MNAPEYPALFATADDRAQSQRRMHFLLVRSELLAVFSATAISVASSVLDEPLLTLGSAALFGAMIVALVFHKMLDSEGAWFEARAAAESAKSLAWRYAMRAPPFAQDGDEAADKRLLARFRDITSRAPATPTAPSGGQSQVTSWMRSLRSLPLSERMVAYREARLLDQLSWYAASADLNRRRARSWDLALIAVATASIVLALAAAAGALFDLVEFAATTVAAIIAWQGAADHGRLTRSYDRAAFGLSIADSEVDHVTLESQWAQFVDDAEETISREHSHGRRCDHRPGHGRPALEPLPVT